MFKTHMQRSHHRDLIHNNIRGSLFPWRIPSIWNRFARISFINKTLWDVCFVWRLENWRPPPFSIINDSGTPYIQRIGEACATDANDIRRGKIKIKINKSRSYFLTRENVPTFTRSYVTFCATPGRDIIKTWRENTTVSCVMWKNGTWRLRLRPSPKASCVDSKWRNILSSV